MPTVADVFERLNNWRHLPAYQLERRADIFISFYLKDALEKIPELDLHLDGIFIPEFPIRGGTIGAVNKKGELQKNSSAKVDYLFVDKTRDQPVFVELKTDDDSISPEQLKYLNQVKQTEFGNLTKGVLQIFQSTQKPFRNKYKHLLSDMQAMGLLPYPDGRDFIKEVDDKKALWLAKDMEPISGFKKPLVIFVKPTLDKADELDDFDGIVTFDDLRDSLPDEKDEITTMLSIALGKWKVKAGSLDQDGSA